MAIDKFRNYAEGLFEEDDLDVASLIDKESEFDLVKLVKKSIDPVTGIPRNMKLPEGDFKEAKNYFDYVSNFLGHEAKFPFARQLWLLTMLLGEYCPRCSDKSFLKIDNVPVDFNPRHMPDRLQYLNYGKCPKCKAEKSELISSKELNLYVEMALCIGQRAGKSTLTSSVVSYVIHKYLKFPKLSSVCDGIAGSTPLTGTFVGGRTSDAIALLWEPINNIISESPWFLDYHSMLSDRGDHYGIEFFRSKDLYLRYAHRNLEFYPSGPTKRGLRGRTRMITATDEIGWFPTTEDSGKDRERADAPEVYDALDRSLLTVRREVRSLLGKGYNNFIPGLAINISSPSSQTDMITKLVNENKTSRRVLAVRLSTWEVNPLYQRDNEEIEEAYRKNPVNAERDYGANPPLNASKFIDVQEDQIFRCFTLNNSAAVEQKSKVIKDRLRIAGSLINVSKPAVLRNSLMAIDAGFTNNAFSVIVITAEEVPLAGGTKSVILKTPVMLEIVPKDGGSLHFSKIYTEILYKLIEAFNVKFLFADRWNSIALLDKAEEDFQKVDFKSTSYSVKYDDFIITKSYLQEQKLLLPKLEMSFDEILKVENYPHSFLGKPAAHLMYQLMTVKDRGKTVIKGNNATDDIFRALVLGVSRALNDKVLPELLKPLSPADQKRRVGAVVTTRLMGGSFIMPQSPSTYLSSNSTPDSTSNTKKNVVLVSRR
jgi:hypothetical protein